MLSESFSIIAVGFSLGLMHALDADHVMAVSALNNQKTSVKRTILFSAHWAFGHAGVLLCCGLFLFGLGWQLPEVIQQTSEILVGVLLICLGLFCFWQIKKQKLRLHQHSHNNVTHVHWHIEGDVHSEGHGQHSTEKNHAPMMVGVVHGLAGSAPALALVPAVSQGQMAIAMLYLGVFSLGVMLSMLVFGLGLGSAQQYLKQKHLTFFHGLRNIIASTSIVIGSYWLFQAM